MEAWTTFFPRKVCWELTHAITKGNGGTNAWLKNRSVIEKALKDLRETGIKGVRLIVTPGELTKDGRKYDWRALDTALGLCQRYHLQVDLSLGPFQYAHYPGIRLPSALVPFVSDSITYLDDAKPLSEYGYRFLRVQLDRYAKDKRIRGFYLGNEWPDQNRVEGNASVKIGVSREFMMEAAGIVKKATEKPVLFNTNIDPSSPKRFQNVFGSFLDLLGGQMRLGFDPYPSRERWRVVPFVKMKRFLRSYSLCMDDVCRTFDKKQLFFAEVEAQPWGGGQSWYRLISESENPQKKIHNYHRDDLEKTFTLYIKPTGIQEVSLWSPEFWLVSKQMGINWPLEQVAKL